MVEPTDFYDLLDVSDDPSEEEIRQAYRTKAREYHPDLNNDERSTHQFQVIKKAYEVLSDPSEREAYDQLGHREYVAKRLGSLPGIEIPELDNADTQGEQSREDVSIHEQRGNSPQGTTSHVSRESETYVNGGMWLGESSERRGIARRDELVSMRTTTLTAHMISISALICYGVGIWRFIRTNRLRPATLANAFAVDGLRGVNQVLIAAGFGTEQLLKFVLEATSTRTLDVAFPIGVAFLPVALGIFAWQSRRPTAWLLVVGSLGPLLALSLEYIVQAGFVEISLSVFSMVWVFLLIFILPACVIFGWSVTAYRELT